MAGEVGNSNTCPYTRATLDGLNYTFSKISLDLSHPPGQIFPNYMGRYRVLDVPPQLHGPTHNRSMLDSISKCDTGIPVRLWERDMIIFHLKSVAIYAA